MESNPRVAVVFLLRVTDKSYKNDLRRFFTSLLKHRAGVSYRFHIAVKGNVDDEVVSYVKNSVNHVGGVIHLLPDDGYDIGAYMRISSILNEDYCVFFNTHSEILIDDWLLFMYMPFQTNSICGMTGATASYFSRKKLLVCKSAGIVLFFRSFALALMNIFKYLSYFEYSVQYPSYHLRTNSFMVRKKDFREFSLQSHIPKTKKDAHNYENGKLGLTYYYINKNMGVYVVGADGRCYRPSQWACSNTFRSSAQENLIVADNQTRYYSDQSDLKKRFLHCATWK